MKEISKFLWIELIGFDNTQPDLGVADLLNRMEVKPRAISLLIWCTDLIHSHSGLAVDGPIGVKHTAYYARPWSDERCRQDDWTKYQLRDLVKNLHLAGVEVYISFFDQLMPLEYHQENGIPKTPEWIDDHPEVRYVTTNQPCADSICIWKRLKDGTYYEDFFCRQLEAFLKDYGFDGLHGADGYAHPRYALWEGDFSDDMMAQFAAATTISVPATSAAERGQWIMKNCRREWIEFCSDRHGQFWQKCIAMLNRNGKKHCLNTCWTREPLEAAYRYGVDYLKMTASGVKNWIVEAQAAVIETEGWNKTQVPMQDYYRSMLARLAAAMPSSNFYLLNCIKDGKEQYNVLRHAPSFMLSDILSMSGAYCGQRQVVSGFMTCLADGILEHEWQRIDSAYQLALSPKAGVGLSPYVVWSPSAHRKEFQAFCAQPRCSSFMLHANLLAQGAVLTAAVPVTMLEQVADRPLVLLHPRYFSAEERQAVANVSSGNYAEVGFLEDDKFGYRIYRCGALTQEYHVGALNPPARTSEAASWLELLPEAMPPAEFFPQVALALNTAFSVVRPESSPEKIRLWGSQSQGQLELYICSEARCYQPAHIRINGRWRAVQATADTPWPPLFTMLTQHEDHATMFVKLPPSGTIKATLQQGE